MSCPFVVSLAWRYVRGRRSLLLHGTARAALISTSLGVTAMVLAMALMSGYSRDLQRKLVGGSAAIVAYALDGTSPQPAYLAALAMLPDVVSVAEVAYGQGSLSKLRDPRGHDIVLRGVDPESLPPGLDPRDLRIEEEVPGALLGSELASRLGVERGEVLRLVAVNLEELDFSYHKLRYNGVFESGFAEADASWVLVSRRLVEQLAGRSSLIEIGLEDPMRTPGAAQAVEAVLGDDFLVTDWRQHNRELFTALRLQKAALFLVLGLIVVVATFNVASTLVVLTRERRREVGVLSALGLEQGRLGRVFVLCGLILGGAGCLAGVALGAFLAWMLTTFELIRFDPGVAAIYFLSSVPFRVEIADLAAVVAFSLAATLLACWVPAHRGARLDPSAALRYD